MTQTKLLRSKIESAKRDVDAAAKEIERLLRGLRGGARAEKTAMSAPLRAAFTSLRAARRDLEALEGLMTRKNDGKAQ